MSYADIAVRTTVMTGMSRPHSWLQKLVLTWVLLLSSVASFAGTLSPSAASLQAIENNQLSIFEDGQQTFSYVSAFSESFLGVALCDPDCDNEGALTGFSDSSADSFVVGPWSVDYQCTSVDILFSDRQTGQVYQQDCTINVSFAYGSVDSTADLAVFYFADGDNQLASVASLSGTNLFTDYVTEEPGTVSFVNASATGAEGTRLQIAVERTETSVQGGAFPGPHTFSFDVFDDGCCVAARAATESTDFTLVGSGELTWQAGESGVKNLEIDLLNDDLLEGTENFQLAINNSGSTDLIGNIGSISIDIEDSTQPPSVISFASDAFSVSEADGTVSLALSRSTGAPGAVSVDFVAADGTATSPADYALLEPLNETVSWAANDFADKQIVFTIVQDDLDAETTEDFSVGIIAFSGGAVAGQLTSATVSIENNVIPRAVGSFSFVNASQTVTEGDAPVSLSVTRTAGSDGFVQLQVQAVSGSATEGSDFTLANEILTWPSGDTAPKSVAFTAIDDLSPEQLESIELQLSPFQGEGTADDNRSFDATFGANQSTTVNINDRTVNTGTFSFNTNALSIPRDDGVARVSVRRTNGSEGAVTLRVFSTDGSAVAGTDYTAVDQILSWAAGDTEPKLVGVNLRSEGAATTPGVSLKTLTLSLVEDPANAATGAIIGDPNEVSITITDDVSATAGDFGFVVDALQVDEEQGQAILEVSRSNGSDGSVSLQVTSTAGTATSGSDFTAVDEVLTWPAGDNQPRQIVVPIASNDGTPEPDETFTVQLTRATGEQGEGDTTALANIVSGLATVTIVDTPDPQPGNIRFTAANVTIDEDAGEITLSVERRSGSDGAVSVDIQLVEGSARTPEDFGAASVTSLSWASGESGIKNFTVPIVFDTVAETSETFTARLVGATPASVLAEAGSSARVTINNVFNGSPGTLQWTMATTNVAEDAGSVILTVSRTGGSDSNVSVSYRTENGSADAGSDFNSTTGVLSWAAGETDSRSVTVPILFDDDDSESTENLFVVLENAEPFGDPIQLGSLARTEVNIVNVAPPETPVSDAGRLSLSATSFQVNESDETVSIVVDRLDSSDGAVSVQYQSVGDTALSGLDFVQADGVLEWMDGDSSSRTIVVDILPDSIVEGSEEFSVNLFNESAEDGFFVTLASTQATVTIEDSTAPGSIVFSPSAYSVPVGDNTVSITLQRVGGSDGELSVEFATEARAIVSADVAEPNLDFIPLTQSVAWLDGESAPQVVTVSIVPPVDNEPPETFTAVLRNQNPVSTASPGAIEASIIIESDDGSGDANTDFDLTIVSGDNQVGAPGDQLEELVIGLAPSDESANVNQVQVQWRSVPAGAVEFVNGNTSSPDEVGQARTVIRLLEPGFISVVARVSDLQEPPAENVPQTARVDGTRVPAGPGEIVFLVRSGIGATTGLLPNQSATGFALDSACDALELLGSGDGEDTSLTPAQQDLSATCTVLNTEGNTELAVQLDRLAPEELFYIADAAIESADLQVTNVFNRINAIRAGRIQESVDLSGLNLNIDGQLIPGTVVNAAKNALNGGAASDDGLVTPFGFFANGSISTGEVGGGDNQRDGDIQTTGLTVGMDYRISSNVVVGTGLGISNNDTDFTGGEGEANLQAINLTAFATFFEADRGYADVVLDIGQNSYEVTRRINFPGAADQFARGETDALVGSLNISAGREFQAGAMQFGPYVRLGYTWASVDAFNEVATTSAPGFGSVLNVKSHEAKSLTMTFGGQVSTVINTSKAVLVPQARLEFELENEADKDDITASFASDPDSTPFTLQGNERDTSHLNVGLGSTVVLRNGRSAYAFYETQLQHDFVSQHWLKFGIRLEF